MATRINSDQVCLDTCSLRVEITDADLLVAGNPTSADLANFVATNSLECSIVYYSGSGDSNDPDYVWDIDSSSAVTNIESPLTNSSETVTSLTDTDNGDGTSTIEYTSEDGTVTSKTFCDENIKSLIDEDGRETTKAACQGLTLHRTLHTTGSLQVGSVGSDDLMVSHADSNQGDVTNVDNNHTNVVIGSLDGTSSGGRAGNYSSQGSLASGTISGNYTTRDSEASANFSVNVGSRDSVANAEHSGNFNAQQSVASTVNSVNVGGVAQNVLPGAEDGNWSGNFSSRIVTVDGARWSGHAWSNSCSVVNNATADRLVIVGSVSSNIFGDTGDGNGIYSGAASNMNLVGNAHGNTIIGGHNDEINSTVGDSNIQASVNSSITGIDGTLSLHQYILASDQSQINIAATPSNHNGIILANDNSTITGQAAGHAMILNVENAQVDGEYLAVMNGRELVATGAYHIVQGVQNDRTSNSTFGSRNVDDVLASWGNGNPATGVGSDAYSFNHSGVHDFNAGALSLGADPTTYNGGALTPGLMYYNTTLNVFRWYNGTIWANL